MTAAELNASMTEVNRRIVAAVARSVARGVEHKAAFAAHMTYLASERPQLFGEYVRWLGLESALAKVS